MRRRKIAGTEKGILEKYRYKGVAEFVAEHPELELEEDTRTEEEREADEQQEYEEFMASVLTEPPFDVSAGKVSIDRRG